MCMPYDNREAFFEKGRAKGWSEARIERAWIAFQAQLGREDAKTLQDAAPPKPLAVGDRVRVKASIRGDQNAQVGEILAIDGIEAWVCWSLGERRTQAIRNLERVGEL